MSRNAKLGLFSIVLLIASGVVISQPSIWQSDDTYLTTAICGGAVAVLLLVLFLIILIFKMLFRKAVKAGKSNDKTASVPSTTIIHDQSLSASKSSLTKINRTRKLTWALTAILISLVGTIALFLTTDLDFIEPKAITLGQVQGISNDFWESLGELYDVDDTVIVESGSKYSFLVNMKNPEIFGVDSIVVTGTSDDLNLMSKEAAFVYDHSISSYSTKAKTFGSGIYDSGKEIAESLWQTIRHPIDSTKIMIDGIKNIPAQVLEIWQKEWTIEAVEEFVNAYLYNANCEYAKNHGLDYQRSILPSTPKIIETETAIYLGGKVSGDVVATMVAYTKMAEIRHLEKLKFLNNLKNFFKYSKLNKIERSTVHVSGNPKLPSMVKRFQRASPKEERIYDNAKVGNPTKVNVNGKIVEVRQKIDPKKEVMVKDEKTGKRVKKNNCDLMKDGNAPYADDGSKVELHHNMQEPVHTEGQRGGYVELTRKEHRGRENDAILHSRDGVSENERRVHSAFTQNYWKARAKEFCK